MNEITTQEIENKLAKARASLYKTAPYFARLCMYLRPVFVETGVPVTAVDRKGNLYINVKSAPSWSVKDTQFFLAHELLHLYTKCFQREPVNVNHQVWNIANDIVINKMIVDELSGLGLALPDPKVITPLYKGFEKYDNWTTEEVYQDLLKNAKPMPNGTWCCDSASRCSGKDESDKGESSSSGKEGESPVPESSGIGELGPTEQWKMRFQKELASGKQAGNLPGMFEQFLTALESSKYNWRRILSLAITPNLKKRYDWRKVNRRTAHMIRTPGQEKVNPEAVCYLDTSGSMSNDNLNEALTEFNAILKLSGGKGWLILGDTDAYHFDKININDLKNVRVRRGGTDFRPIFEEIKNRKVKPRVFVGFSDLEGPFPDVAPEYPVFWCRPKGTNARAPFGRIIDVNFKKR